MSYARFAYSVIAYSKITHLPTYTGLRELETKENQKNWVQSSVDLVNYNYMYN